MKLFKSLNGQTSKILFIVSICIGFSFVVNGYFHIYEYAPKTVIQSPGDKNKVKVEVPKVPGLKCPTGWKTTGGSDPDTASTFISCTDGHYVVTTRQGGGTAALDLWVGQFVDPKTIPAYR